ncbi:lipopolysaccharide biosynthesis protein [Pigmentiphaga soli]|uniref:lipopolysaccharide biosynthesis protein n=1 Tax=Pigmentiphaga soli TaxID=1007095 RepID=UPI0031EEB5A8
MFHNLRSKFTALHQRQFFRSVSVLVGGTAIAQAVMALALPIITRLYTPQDFSILAIYISLVGTITSAACLRFEIAIPLPESDEDAINLVALASSSVLVISIAMGFLFFCFHDLITQALGRPGIGRYLWTIPIGVLLIGIYNALQYWATRKKQFQLVARTRMSQAIGSVGVQIGWGLFSFGPLGLLLGQLITGSAGILNIWRRVLREDRALLREVSFSRMRGTFLSYIRFPKFSALEALANSAGAQLPILFIAAWSAPSEAGQLMLAIKVMQIPLGLIGSAVAQVYLSRAPQEHRSESLNRFTMTTLSGLTKAGFGPLLFAGILAPPLFSLAFGPSWVRAGELVRWLVPWLMLQFLASPISMVMHIKGHQKLMLLITIGGFLFRCGTVYLFGLVAKNLIAEAYSITGLIFYSICLIIFCRSAGINLRGIMRALISSGKITSIWVIAAIAMSLLYTLITRNVV